MTRNKAAVLGLSALALLAISALAASSAQGIPKDTHEFTCKDAKEDKVHVHCTGDGIEAKTHRKHDGAVQENHQFDTPAGTVTCKTTEFNVTTDADGTSTEAPTEPIYKECSTNLGHVVHVTMNGCEYKFYIEKTIETAETPTVDEAEGSASLVCPPEKTVEVHVTKIGGGEKCTVTIHGQETIKPIYYRIDTNATTDVTVEAMTAKVKAKFHGGFFNCGVAEGGEATTEYTGNTTVQATDTEKNFINADFSKIP